MRDHRAGVLQQTQVRELQATPVPARKGKGYSGGAEAFSDDLIPQSKTRMNCKLAIICVFVLLHFHILSSIVKLPVLTSKV